MEFYQLDEKDVRLEVNDQIEDLSVEQIKQKQVKDGFNELRGKKKTNPFVVFLKQFLDFLVIILIISAIVSFFFKEISSGIVILVVITINAILGTVQELKAEKSINSLKKLSAPVAKVKRNGVVVQIPSREVVVGDIIELEAGDYISADARLIKCNSLKVDESPLTGESLPVEKHKNIINEECPLAERKNMVYAGCFVTYGRAEAIVCNIGMQTEIGKIATLLQNAKEKKTPLQRNLDSFGKKLSIIIMILCLIIMLVQIFAMKAEVIDAIMFAIALAVAAIPEALSSIVSIVLAFGTQKMAKQGAIMRKLQSVESLGSVSIICSDKTGTLTQNKMTVEHYFYNFKDYDFTKDKVELDSIKPLLVDSIFCNDAILSDGKSIGDPTEIALIDLGLKYEYKSDVMRMENPRISEVPFDSNRKLMSVLINTSQGLRVITKGAVDVILNRSKFIFDNGEVRLITENDKKLIAEQNLHYSENGLRVLALTYKNVLDSTEITTEDEYDLIFLGLIAMMDPPRVESKQAVEECKKAGIIPVMITGDHVITASAIAKRIGILSDSEKAVEGKVIDNLSNEELKDFVKDVRVFARVTPEHKIRIVKAWQDCGNIVSMTGDGVNDAPALKQADVGVAMGITGTEVSKDASSMILTDDNFATIVKAIENGRNIFTNIKKAIQFLISGNFAAIIVVLVCSCLLLPVPFSAVQLLFINLLTDSLPAIALGFEPNDPLVMNQKPRKANSNIMDKKFLLNVLINGLIIFSFVFGAFMIGYNMDKENLANNIVTNYSTTFAFATLCLSRLLHSFSSKSDKFITFKTMFNNKFMILSFLIGLILLTFVTCTPYVNTIFNCERLTIIPYLIVVGMALGSFVGVQLVKSIIYFSKKIYSKNKLNKNR